MKKPDTINQLKILTNKIKDFFRKDQLVTHKTLYKQTKKPNREDEELVTGTIVVLFILIILIGIGYYYLVYSPNMEELNLEKNNKINKVNSIFKDDLSNDSTKQALISRIESANSIEEVEAIDVDSEAYPVLKNKLENQIEEYSDKYDRVEINVNNTPTIMSTENATTYLDTLNTTQLVDTTINVVDTVIVPISIDRKQAASGLIKESDTVDIYFQDVTSSDYVEEEDTSSDNMSTEDDQSTSDENTSTDEDSASTENMTNQTNDIDSYNSQNQSNNGKVVGGATVLSILRSKDSGSIDSQTEISQSNSTNYTQTNTIDIEQVLSSKAAGVLNESELNLLLEDYGWRLSDYERTSNIGDLDVEYLIMLEVPRSSVETIINNMDNIVLTIPTYDAPSWVNITE
ncbi:MAG: DUF515 domain-containing protein [Methanosphaera sp.]|nr:DUF515 domain-containing protein [Methanosphaera sp.]